MATVIFYEKPGCINNTKQKALLEAAGHRVEARNLLTETWTAQRLQPFLGEHPVGEWFNRSAPAVKSGQVVPELLDATAALALLTAEPLLIRRPLLHSGDRYAMGFDIPMIEAWLGLTAAQSQRSEFCQEVKQQDLQTCPRTPTHV